MREIINSVKWVSAWLSFQAVWLGWYEISHIYWKSGKKWEISYLSPFLTFTSICNCWLVRVSYGVITSAPLFTFVVIFFSLALKGYFPYVMFNTLALLLLSILRGGGEFWNVGGSSLTQPYANPYSNFPKCLLRYSLAQANVFAVFTVSTVSVIDLWQCISRLFFLSRLRADNMRSEVTDVTSIVKYISKSVFRHQNVWGPVLPNFCLGWELRNSPLALMLHFSSIVTLCGVTDTCLGPEAVPWIEVPLYNFIVRSLIRRHWTCWTRFQVFSKSRRIFNCQFIFFSKKSLQYLPAKLSYLSFTKLVLYFFLQIIPYFLFNKTSSEKKIFGVVFFVSADRKNELLALITPWMKIQTCAKLYRYYGAWV